MKKKKKMFFFALFGIFLIFIGSDPENGLTETVITCKMNTESSGKTVSKRTYL